MNTQAKVALDKQKHPERYCAEPRCLWKVMEWDHGTFNVYGEGMSTDHYKLRADCPNGYCPRHQRRTR